MDGRSFDRLARWLGGDVTRRQGLRATIGAALGIVASAPAVVDSAKRGDGSGERGKDRQQGKGRRKPSVEGPCGNGSRKENACTKNRDCCTGLCNMHRAKKNIDGKGRCRCAKSGRPCKEQRNCCGGHQCVEGVCGGKPAPGPSPDPDVPVPTGEGCIEGKSTCADERASCIAYDRGSKRGTYCLLPFEAECTADEECVNAACSVGVCVSCSCGGCPSGECVADVCDSGCDHGTVQGAIDAAASGDVIHIAPGTYDEDLSITGKSLTLVGCPGGEVILRNATVGVRAIVVSDSSKLELVDIVVEGNNNSLADDGGGIETFGDVTLCRFTQIRNNKGPDSYGGGLYLRSSGGPGGPTLRVLDGSAITGNHDSYGGGVAIDLAGQVIVQDDAVIADNSSDTYGGGIYLNSAARAIIRGNARVTGNTTGSNGAGIFYYGGGYDTGFVDVPIEVSGNALFDGNISDSYGGAIGAGYCESTGKETISVRGNAVFSNNKANGTSYGGGAIMSYRCRVLLTDNVKFIENTTGTSGGALHVYGPGDTYGVMLDVSGDVEFTGNTADSYGGAMYLEYVKGRIGGRAVLSGNFAADRGGAVGMSSSSLALVDSVTMSGNSADVKGGAISANFEDNLPVLNIVDNVEISGNTAGAGGGIHVDGVYWDTYTPYIGGDAKITGNSAKVIGSSSGQGGGLYINGGPLRVGGRAEFSGNTAEAEGGAIYVNGGANPRTITESVRLVGSSVISGNTAKQGGGVYLKWQPQSGASPQVLGLKVADLSTITGNTATDPTPSGGGVYSDNASNTFSAVPGSISGNTPDQCAGAGATC